MNRNLPSRLSIAVLVWVSLWPIGRAHDPGLSSADLRLNVGDIRLELTLSPTDAFSLIGDAEDGGGSTASRLEAQRHLYLQAARGSVRLEADGEELPVAELEVDVTRDDDGDNVRFRLSFAHEGVPQELSYTLTAFSSLPRGHRHYLTIRDPEGQVVADRILDPSRPSFVHRSGRPTGSSFSHFFWLGIEHIVFGYDHLLFLAALLVVGLGFKESVKVITSFTIAHSITLACATFEWINLPASLVEPLIAASILYVGVENLIRQGPPRERWLLTFFFGLIHGLGFASLLRELGVGRGGEVLAPLLGFNLGVEAGQIAVAIPLVASLTALARRPEIARPLTIICSAAVIAAGGYWLLERTIFS